MGKGGRKDRFFRSLLDDTTPEGIIKTHHRRKLLEGERKVELDLTARRSEQSNGRQIRAKVDLSVLGATEYTVTCGASGDNTEHQEEQYMMRTSYPGERGGPTLQPTLYTGEVRISPWEICTLFAAVVDNAEKSEDFKRMCHAMIKELQRRPKKRRG